MQEIPQTLLSNSKLKKEDRLIDFIIKVVSKYYDVEDNYFTTKNRKRELVVARQTAMYFIVKYSTATLEKTGNAFGGKDHATVLHGVRTIKNLIDCDKVVKQQINELDNIICHKAKAFNSNLDLDSYFYYVDFNDYNSIRINNTKGIILTGFSDEEVIKIKELLDFNKDIKTRNHLNTGYYILEDKIEHDKEN